MVKNKYRFYVLDNNPKDETKELSFDSIRYQILSIYCKSELKKRRRRGEAEQERCYV